MPISRKTPWVSTRIPVRGDRGSQIVDAQVQGQVAIHPRLVRNRPSTSWTVTSRSTGLALAHVRTEEAARRIGFVLASKFDIPLSLPQATRLRRALPPWVRTWLLACTRQGEYIDPQVYQKEEIA